MIADLDAAGPVDEVLLGGDLAQGGPQPAEVIDELRRRGWRSVRGNSDDLLVEVADGVPTSEPLPLEVAERARWSVEQLGPERIEYLRSLPLRIELGPYACGSALLVHATPWNNTDVVLPEADEEIASRVLDAAGTALVLYGHIHTPYQRRVGERVLASVGAICGSNEDPRPAYTIVEFGDRIRLEARRVGEGYEKAPAARRGRAGA